MNKGDIVVIELSENPDDDFSPLAEYKAVVMDTDEYSYYLASYFLYPDVTKKDDEIDPEDVAYVIGITLPLGFEPKSYIKTASSEEEVEANMGLVMESYVIDLKESLDEVTIDYPSWAVDMALAQPDVS
jgi:hypothetical protein